ncbi:hypothetical protein niasHT_013980 [Heterodera trifolii]|uniref:NADH dehydrogenase [ubiquinone] 1 beta subcomplex subunit 11, mitochondrial n=1 Tax=Heterodera trifolii TaxID=157864 RepID=A0ABD2KLI1_9BILA
MASLLRFLACRHLSMSSILRKEAEQLTNEHIDKIRQRTRFSETSAFYGRGSGGRTTGGESDEDAFTKPFYIASYYDSKRFEAIRGVSIFASISLLLLYVALFREPNEVDELWDYDMRLVYFVAKKRVLKEQIEQAKKGGQSTVNLETDLIDIEVQEEKIREEEEKKAKKEAAKKKAEQKRTTA